MKMACRGTSYRVLDGDLVRRCWSIRSRFRLVLRRSRDQIELALPLKPRKGLSSLEIVVLCILVVHSAKSWHALFRRSKEMASRFPDQEIGSI